MDDAGARATEPVVLRNMTRNALRFNVPGRAVYLRPGETISVVRGHLLSEEVKVLCHRGSLAALAPAPPPKPHRAGTPAAMKSEAAPPEVVTPPESQDDDEIVLDEDPSSRGKPRSNKK